MLTIVHLLTGAAIGKNLENIILIIFLAILSHYIIDFIPHHSFNKIKGFKKHGVNNKNEKELLIKSIDSILGVITVIISMFLFKEKALLIFIGGFFAWLPDLFQFYAWETDNKFLKKVIPMPCNKLYNQTSDKVLNIILQSLIALIAFIFLFFSLNFQYSISIIILASAIPLGFLLKELTKDEKKSYKKYFPAILWILAITSAIFYTINILNALILTFLFIFVFFWNWK